MPVPAGERRCPICERPLAQKRSQGVEVDQCPGCKGLWLDAGEFDALIGQRFAGRNMEAALRAGSQPAMFCRDCGMSSGVLVDPGACPRCGGVVTARCPVDGSPMDVVLLGDLEFDLCPICLGLWIDGDERQEVARATTRASQSADQTDTPQRSVPSNQSPPPEAHDDIVVCTGCLQRVPRQHTLSRAGDVWCEECVVAGKVPTLQGKSLSQLQAEAAASFARARADQAERRAGVETVSRARQRVRIGPRGLRRHGSGPLLANVTRSAVKKVRRLFGGEKEPWE